jgi:hypothetical protein
MFDPTPKIKKRVTTAGFILISSAVLLLAGIPAARIWTGKPDGGSQKGTVVPTPDTDDYLIVIAKSEHMLYLCRNGTVVDKWPCNIRNERPDRERENDGQTPEGVFTIWQLAVVDPWTRWMALDTVEKSRGIYLREHPDGEEILKKHERKYGPITTDADIRQFNRFHPDKPYLRGFGIHGGGYYPGNDWTLGYPALDDADVIELYNLIRSNPRKGIGTVVMITD